MRVLVTGATGLIGTHLVPDLLDRGHAEIASDIVPVQETFADQDRVTYIRLNLINENEVAGQFAERQVDCVIHLASRLAEFCEADPEPGYGVNVMATLSPLDACDASQVNRFLMTSTPAVSGPGRVNGITADYSSKLLDAVARGEEVIVDTPDAVGDWLYAKDAVKALVLLVERAGDAPELTCKFMGEEHSVSEAMAIAQDLYPGTRITIRRDKEFHYPYAASFDDRRTREDIGWSPDYPVRRGIKQPVETVRKPKRGGMLTAQHNPAQRRRTPITSTWRRLT